MVRDRLKTYYTLAATQALSSLGSRISSLAIGIWIFQQTGRATPLTLVAVFAVLPSVLGGGFAGALADRFDRRLVMVCADAGQAVGTILLLVSFSSGAFQLWHLYVIAVSQAVFATAQTPAFQATIAMLTVDAHRDRANAIVQMIGPAAGVLAPALAGLIYAASGVAGAIAVDLATFLVAVVVVLNLRIPIPAPTAEGAALRAPLWRQAFDGVRYLAARPTLFAFGLYATAFNFIVSVASVLLTPYLLARTGSETALGFVFAALNGGAIAGSIAAAAAPRRGLRIHGMMAGVSAASVFLAISGVAREPWSLAASLFCFAAALPFLNVPYMSIMQAKIAPDVQGRVFAAMGQLGSLTAPIAFLAAGPLADRVFEPAVARAGWSGLAPFFGAEPGAGMGLIVALSGILSLLLSIAVYFGSPIRRIETSLPDYVPETADAGPERAGAVLEPQGTELPLV
jgi:DHA3 family macrolide efflux protein-like MFS transporter